MKYYFIILLTLFSLSSIGQTVRFVAQCKPKKVVLGKYFQLSFTLHEAKGKDFSSPSLRDFKIVTGPNPSSNMTIVNGAMSHSMGYSYYLEPLKVGKFKIGAASIKVGRKTYRTKPINIEVVQPEGYSAETQQALRKELEKQVFIRAEVDKSTAYIGEQVTLDFKIYSKLDVHGYNMAEQPDFKGFFAKDVSDYDNGVTIETVNGKEYSVKIIRRIALFPQQAGTLEIGSLIMNLGISTTGSSFGFFSEAPSYQPFSTPPISVNVKSLPTDVPENFTGAIGDYTMMAVVNQKVTTTDESIILQMQVTGDGDVKRVQAPRLNLASEDFEIYDPQISETSFEEDGKILSTKTMTYVLLPRKAGKYDLMPEFTFFDTDSVGFKTLKGENINLTISQGSGKNTQNPSEKAKTINDIKPIKTRAKLRKRNLHFFGSVVFWLLFLLPFLVFARVGYYKRALDAKGAIDKTLLKKQQANKVAQQRLAKAKEYLDSEVSGSFFESVSQALWGFVSDKLNIPTSEISKENIRNQLEGLNVESENIDKFLNCIKNCEMALFASMDNTEAMNKTYQDAIEVIENIVISKSE